LGDDHFAAGSGMSATAPQRELPPLPRGAIALWASVLAGFSAVIGIVARSWPQNLIYFGAGAGAILLSFAGSVVALPLYFCTTFGSEILPPGLPISLNRALALLLALAAGNEFLRGRSQLKVTPALLLMVLLHTYILTAAFIKLPENGEMFIQPAFYLIIALIVACNAWRESWRIAVLWMLFILSIAISGIGYLEFVVGGDITLHGIESMPRGAIRINGISRDAIQYGFNASWGGFIGLYLLTRVRGAILPQLVAAGTAVTLLAAVLTLNRQVPFILGAMLVTFVFMCRWKFRRHLAIALVAGAVALTPVVGWKIIERIFEAKSHVGDPSFAIRYDKAMIGGEMIVANPLDRHRPQLLPVPLPPVSSDRRNCPNPRRLDLVSHRGLGLPAAPRRVRNRRRHVVGRDDCGVHTDDPTRPIRRTHCGG
jgi:hypothetical protein